MYEHVHFAFTCGVLAATGSAFGKLSGLPIFEGYFLWRILFFGLMLMTNAASLTFFVKALQKTITVNATVISSATNYTITALIGVIFFHETASPLWWSGTFLILLGLVLIVSNTTEENNKDSDKIE